jgi:hypothetical protein
VVFGLDVVGAIQQTASPEGIPLEIVRITGIDIAQGQAATELLELAESINASTTPTTTGP